MQRHISKVLIKRDMQEKETYTAHCPQAHLFLGYMRLDWWPSTHACKPIGKMDSHVVCSHQASWLPRM